MSSYYQSGGLSMRRRRRRGPGYGRVRGYRSPGFGRVAPPDNGGPQTLYPSAAYPGLGNAGADARTRWRAAAGGGAAGGGGYGTEGDPILAQIMALTAKQRAEARARALAAKKQAAVEYGDASGFKEFDVETIRAARENPFSILKRITRGYDEGVVSLEDTLNKSNLFYSGARGTELGRAATAVQGERYDAGNRFRGFITDTDNALAEALLNADMMDLQARMDAYYASLGGALEGGYDPGAADGLAAGLGAPAPGVPRKTATNRKRKRPRRRRRRSQTRRYPTRGTREA